MTTHYIVYSFEQYTRSHLRPSAQGLQRTIMRIRCAMDTF